MREKGIVEIQQGEVTWTSRDFQAYLLAQSCNPVEGDFCLETQRFPRRIDISPDWHQVLNQLRAQTAADGVEYWSLIGVTDQRERVMVMRDFVRGKREEVDAEGIAAARRRAFENGITHCVGDAHSHTAGLMEKLVYATDHFSPGDLYDLLYSRIASACKLLVGPNRNLAVCRSIGSEFLPPAMNQKTFERLWEARFRWEYMLGNRWGADFEIGKRHHLIFYEGKPQQPLARVFP